MKEFRDLFKEECLWQSPKGFLCEPTVILEKMISGILAHGEILRWVSGTGPAGRRENSP